MPLIEIKNRYKGEVIHAGEYADLREAVLKCVADKADLRSANLRSANLRYADLSSANLRYADLSYANLSYADLRSANLRSADLRYADLSSANLRYADLSSANLRYADLSYANLSYADLRYADLSSANLRYADLCSAKNAEHAKAATLIVPDGELRVWKKCSQNVTVHLLIPADARRSNATGRKCRAEFADVLDVIGAEVGISLHDGKTEYRKGERVTCDKWEEDRFIECGGGIHFYITREEAEAN